MAGKSNRKSRRTHAPVATGHDKRGRERKARESFDIRGNADAPDGISGRWG